MKQVDVVAGVILDASRQQVLLAKRRADQHQGGLWEYPGGKCEPAETDSAALVRELEEEVGIVVESLTPLLEVNHSYSDKAVRVHFFVVTRFSGSPTGREGQTVSWMPLADLHTLPFPAANQTVAATLDQWLLDQ